MSTALIVGGASGIGLATAKKLHAGGATVVIADVNADGARAAAEDLGDGANWRPMDVTDEASVQAGFADLPGLRTVVDCAGLSLPGAVVDQELSAWQTTLDVCLTGTFLVMKHAGRTLVDGGTITAVASLNGRQPGTGMAAYCAAKAGVLMLVQVAAMELAERGIRVNAVSPGLVDTPLTAPIDLLPGLREDYLENTPLGRAGTPDDVADTICFLASDAARWMTGSAIDLNGGAHTRRYPDTLARIRDLMDG